MKTIRKIMQSFFTLKFEVLSLGPDPHGNGVI